MTDIDNNKRYELIKLNRDIVINDYDNSKKKNKERYIAGDKRAGSEYTYINQKVDALNIIDMFYNSYNLRVISIIKKTKVGMNGLIIEIVKNISTHSMDDFVIHRDNIFIITGMSNTAWVSDLKDTIPVCFKENIFHNGKLNKITEKIKKLKTGLIIIDEIDSGDKNNQRLHKLLDPILNIETMKNNNIRIIMVSATIYNELKNLNKWAGETHKNYFMTIPDSYIGHEYFLEKGIIKESFRINDEKTAEKWVKEDIYNNYGTDYRVHIIRIEEKYESYVEKICKKYKYDFRNHTSEKRISNDDMDALFVNVNNHIIIAVKGLLRRADFIPNSHKLKIGSIHEQYCIKPDANVQVQALPGRLSGYWRKDIEDGHKTGPYRCSTESIKQYINFTNNPLSCDIKYNTNSGLNNIVNPNNIKNLEIKKVIDYKEVPIIITEFDNDSRIFKKDIKLKKIERIEIIKNTLNKNKSKYNKLINYISNKDIICKQITRPDETKSSYKKHITDVINASYKNNTYALDLSTEDKKTNNWQGFIDTKNKKVCILIWCIDKDLYK